MPPGRAHHACSQAAESHCGRSCHAAPRFGPGSVGRGWRSRRLGQVRAALVIAKDTARPAGPAAAILPAPEQWYKKPRHAHLLRSSARDGALLGTGSGPATSRPSSGAGAAGRPTSASQATGAAPSRDAAAKRPQSARSPDRQRTAPAVPWVHAGAPVRPVSLAHRDPRVPAFSDVRRMPF